MSDKHTVQALRVLLLTAARLYALASNRSLKEFKRALHESVDGAAASSPATQDDRHVMQAAFMEIARLPEQE
jgi:hypothetical protein